MIRIRRTHDIAEARRETLDRQYHGDHRPVESITHTFTIRQTIPSLPDGKPYTDVCELCANGEDLNFIVQNFGNIPVRLGASMAMWRGSIAQFIYENLQLT